LRVLVLGIGNMGRFLTRELAMSDDVSEVVAADVDINRVQKYINELRSDKVKAAYIDITNYEKTVDLMRQGFDVVASALNYIVLRDYYFNVVKAAIEARVNYTDLVFFPRGGYLPYVFDLDKDAKAAGITIVPGIGLDPGIDRVLEGYAASKLDKVEKIHMWCGGFPQKDTPGYRNPLHYKITFTWASVIRAVHGKASILQGDKIVEMDKLIDPEILEFPEPVGRVEAFWLEAPLDLIEQLNLKDVEEAWCKTVRWPGYCEMWRKLIDLKMTSTEPLRIKGCEISPREFLIDLGNKTLQYEEDEGDLAVLRVGVIGEKNGEKTKYTYNLIDFYDKENKITAMGRTTTYPCSIVTRMIGRGDLSERGVIHPGKIGWDHRLANMFFSELAKRKIHIEETVTKPLT